MGRQLKADSTRKTRQKAAIRAAFEKANRPLTPDEVLSLGQTEGASLSLATVYRNINALVEEQWLQPVGVMGMASRYEVAGKPHHHHFHCTSCGKLFELEGCSLPKAPKIPRGFNAVGHEMLVHGSCSECGPPC